MSWRNSLGLIAHMDVGVRHQTGLMSGITALPGAPIEMNMMAGGAAARHQYCKREGTRGTVIARLDCPKAEPMMTPCSTACLRVKRGAGEGTEVLGGWTRTVTLLLKAAPEERAAIVITAGHLATAQKMRTLCLRTLSSRLRDTAGLTKLQSGTAQQNLPDQRGTGPQRQP